MADRPIRRWIIWVLAALLTLLATAAFIWRDDILRTTLDPKEPFQIYSPPPAPDYSQRAAWALLPAKPEAWSTNDPPADVFFISPTTFNGGAHWNAPINDTKADRLFRRMIAPNYVGPFQRAGRLFAPRYRQASLYSLMTLREDAREARRFAYADVAAAFRRYIQAYNNGRPFLIVGVEQGGTLAERLLAEEVATDPALKARLAGAYMIEAATPADAPPITPCRQRAEAGCLAAWVSAFDNDPQRAKDVVDRSLVWAAGAQLENLHGRLPLCFNPLFGATTTALAPAKLGLGAANATGLEWGARPPFLTRQVSAQCRNGVLRISRPKASMLKPQGDWADRQKVPGYNLFYADLEADAMARVATLLADPNYHQPAPAITTSVALKPSPVHALDGRVIRRP
ncbi:DUF3089 domain-containing protein [Phenylobacterium aquaticum]|uniref:DUF3089 domain-containing protein n=1 Tax=Phenylobacterium aquaticum TaxID=1763816 RepID=UPI0026F21358|nr:DUF3089 domain-containing protein [Phenylobacterium aquaticum]